jgi:hypothetical protein
LKVPETNIEEWAAFSINAAGKTGYLPAVQEIENKLITISHTV